MIFRIYKAISTVSSLKRENKLSLSVIHSMILLKPSSPRRPPVARFSTLRRVELVARSKIFTSKRSVIPCLCCHRFDLNEPEVEAKQASARRFLGESTTRDPEEENFDCRRILRGNRAVSRRAAGLSHPPSWRRQPFPRSSLAARTDAAVEPGAVALPPSP